MGVLEPEQDDRYGLLGIADMIDRMNANKVGGFTNWNAANVQAAPAATAAAVSRRVLSPMAL